MCPINPNCSREDIAAKAEHIVAKKRSVLIFKIAIINSTIQIIFSEDISIQTKCLIIPSHGLRHNSNMEIKNSKIVLLLLQDVPTAAVLKLIKRKLDLNRFLN